MFIGCALIALFATLSAGAQETPRADGSQTPHLPPPANVTGSGTSNFIPRWTGSTTLGDSKLFQTGGMIGVGTTTPTVALDVNGRVNVSRSYRMMGQDLIIKPGNPGTQNLGVGFGALQETGNTFFNTAVGDTALNFNTAGNNNTAVGAGALLDTAADGNTGIGSTAAFQNVSGTENTALGAATMFANTSGSQNTAVGTGAMPTNVSGNLNIAIGFEAAMNVPSNASNNIHIGSSGQSTDNAAIRIGDNAVQTSFFVAGVNGVPTGVNDAVPVLIDTHGQLGTVNSSLRYKEDVQDMGSASAGLMRLRPVTFRYRKAFEDGSKPMQYGLIAEEVADVYPDLVTHSSEGEVQAVKYQVLDSMLLNEVQRQQKEIQALEERLAKMESALAAARAEHR